MYPPTILLERMPEIEEFEAIINLSDDACECREHELCKPCEARKVLNGAVELADKL